MAAIISGNSLGLSNSSLATLGSQGLLGSAQSGRSGENVFVDSSTGNLVLQDRDELLLGRGPDLGLVRTYNSQGLLNDDNADNWRIGVYKKVTGLTGTVNTAGSTVRRTDGDGAESVYSYDASSGVYVNKDGGGAFDTLSFNATTQVWTFTDGASQGKELYDNANGGRITQMQDTDGNSLTYTYNAAGLITQVSDASGESTFLDYTGTNLTQIRTVMGASTLTRVRYGYDASNRLSTVTVDLSPQDNSVTDAKTYVTTYTYDGTSTRVATLTQSDGTHLVFAYVQVGTAFKVASITDALGQVTSFSYTGGAGTTVNANQAVLSTTVTTNTNFNLVASALTTPVVGWSTAALRAGSATTSATGVQTAFDQNGNGMAIWASGATLVYSLYNKNNDTWGAATTLDGSLTGNPGTPNLSMSANGNALVTWVQNNNVYARRYIAGVWDGATTIPNLENLTGAAVNPIGAINNNGRAVVAFIQAVGTTNNLYTNVYNGTTWATAATAVDDIGTANTNSITNTTVPSVAIDPLNNATVLWLQKTGTQTADSLYLSRFSASTSTWSAPASTTLENTTTAVTGESIAFDANGNGIAIWLQGGSLFAKSYTRSTNAWSASTTLGTAASAPNLSMSANGNGLVSWVNANNILTRRYAAGAWVGTGATTIESATGVASSPTGAINDAGQAAVAFVQASGTTNNVVVNRFTAGAWQTATTVESNANSVAATMVPEVAIDAQGNINTLWLQKNGTQTTDSVYSNHFNTSTTPYYTIPNGGATWAAVATAVYGSATPATQLQSALGNPALAVGNRLSGFPATLTVTTTTTVPPYYAVRTGDSWTSITQTVYGTSDPNAVAALQTALGFTSTSPVPAVGTRLTVPASLTYNGGQTTVTDALGKATVVSFDGSGQLINVTAPAVGGVSQQVSYAYDSSGNLTGMVDARGNAVSYSYDAKGNRTLDRDAAGNTVSRTFGAKNELLTETVYVVPDPDGAGAGQPGTPLTTRYAYSATNHLRFVVSAEGRVTEYRYDSFGQQVAAIQYAGGVFDVSTLAPTASLTEAQLTTFVGTADKTKSLRVDTSYNFRGQVASTTAYAAVDAAGNGVVNGTESVRQYVYDQAGNLLSTVDPRGVATTTVPNDFTTSYVYDGLNRVLSSTDATGRTTLTQYDDANRKVVLTLANGLVNTSTFDATGQLVSVLQSANSVALGTTSYFYDADGQLRRTVDATGVTSHILYDEAGRKIATIDGNGTLSEYRYNADNQVTRTIQYASAVSAANLASLVGTGGAPTTVTLATIRPTASSQDRSTWRAYDSAGRLVKSVDELGFVTQSFYDGASRLTDTVRFATAISTASLTDAPTVASINPASNANDRLTRSFYDGEGRLLGTLDAEGFLAEYKYDAAGELIETVGYATVTAAALRTTGTLAQLRPVANANDIHSFTLYNAKGQVVGQVDGESFLTESVYDSAGNKTQSIRYATRASFTPGATIAAIRPAANALDQVSAASYTALNQVASETSFEGTLTNYSYDEVGNLTQTVRAVNTTDVRTLNAQYDKQGRMTAQLNGNGSALLTGNLTQAQIDAIWAANAIKYTYDAAGRRTSTTDANGNKTLFYYDADGHLTHSINALGEVQENRYNVLEQLTQTISYGTRLSGTTLATLTGGLVNATLTSAITGITNAALDSSTTVSYTLRGQLASATDALAFATTQTYNAFGETIASSQAIGSGLTLDHTYAYDKRGLLTQMVWDPTGVNSSASTVYDAFGRAISSTDANGNLRTQSYDKLGRVLTTVDPTNSSRVMTYDAFGRTLTQRDALGNTTSFTYNNANRSIVMTTPEGITVTTVHNRFGQTQTITDGRGGSTQYAYDKDGNLTQATDALGQLSTSIFDKADRLTETVDARGIHVVYTYDAANRVLTRTLDPGAGHLSLVTTYAYDAKGENTSVTDANGTVTQTQFDLKGEVVRTILDPTGLNIRTAYAYDGRGKVLTLTQGEGSAQPIVTQYTYDKLGRRTREQLDPAGLNLSTTYAYDKNNNAVTRTDPLSNLTRYVYDADDRLVYTIDPLGGVTENGYDAEGRAVKTVAYAASINMTGLSATPTVAQVQALVTPIANAAKDALQRNVFDRDGRMVYGVSGIGAVTQFVYDANGNVIDRIGYANAIPTTTAATTAAVAAAVALVTDAAHDGRLRTVYDALNRATFTVDGTGAVTKFTYDANGNVIDRTSYATAIPTSTAATAAAIGAAVVNDAAHDSHVRMVYDAANRIVYSVDGLGAVTQNIYDADSNVLETIAYANKIPTATAATAAAIQAALVPSAALDGHTCWTYDSANRMVFSVDALGAVTQSFYDANSNLTQRIAYANKVNVALPATAAAVQAALTANAARVDNRGMNLTGAAGNYASAPDSAANSVTGDFDLRVEAAATDWTPAAVQDIASKWQSIVSNQRSYVLRLTTTGILTFFWSPDGTNFNTINSTAAVPAADGASKWIRVTLDVDNGAAGNNVTFYTSDDGVTWTQLGATVTTAGVTSIFDSTAPLVLGQKQTLSTENPFAGKIYYAEFRNGINGAVVAKFNPSANAGSSIIGSFTSSTGESWTLSGGATLDSATSSQNETTTLVYDAAKRVVYTVDAMGGVTQNIYDANGNLTRTVAYATVLTPAQRASLGSAPSVAAMQTLVSGIANSAQDRFVQRVSDADNRLVYTVDALGFVTKNEYDSLSRITRTTRFANPVPSTTPATLAGVAAALTPNATTDEVNTFTYDAGGRLTQSSDALGLNESYTYDARGDTRTFTNKKGAVTTYTYDADGRKLTESGPTVDISTISAALAVSTAQGAVVTGIQYDALGRVVARTEAQGRPEARTTRYVYDAAGHQIQTIFPQVFIYNAAADNLGTSGTTGTVSLTEVLATLTSTVTFDALGNALVNRDVAGNFSYKVYDTAGRMRFDVDAEHDVTEYVRDAFGNVMRLVSYATPLNFGARDPSLPLTIADVQGMLAAQGAAGHAGDRTIATGYDTLNRAVQEVQPAAFNYDPDAPAGSQSFTAGATTNNIYNAFGQIVQVQTLKNPLTNSWINTITSYYDRDGNKTATVDALGFLTTMAYDAEGNLVDRKEFAQALGAGTWSTAGFPAPAVSADDRETRYAYNRDNLKVSDTRVNVEFSTAADGTSARGDVTTTYGYDAVGNLTRTTDALGGSTFTYYDAMGRVVAVVSPQRTDEPDAVSVTPLIVFKLDAYGNVVQRIDYALGAAAGANESTFAIAGASAADRSVLSRYDTFGHAIQTVDGNGHSRFASYDALGHLAKLWQPITSNDGTVQNSMHVFQYDKVGRQIADIEPSALPNLVQQLQTGAKQVSQAFINWGIASSSIVNGDPSGVANSVSVAWDSLAALGQGDVLVNLSYVTQDVVTGRDEAGNITGINPAAPNSMSFVFSGGSVLTGATLSWNDGSGISSISRIQVFKKDANGNWAPITDRSTPGAYGNHLSLPGPVEPGVQVTLQYRASGTANPLQLLTLQHFDGLLADVTSLGTGSYDFVLTYSRQGVAYATQTGTFTTAAAAGGTVVLTGSSLISTGFVQRQTRYDAFGEATAKGINGAFQEYFDYDAAGRMWRTNNGDGINKVALYDVAGDTTADIRSRSVDLRAAFTRPDDVAAATGTVRTETRYDALGRKVRQAMPSFVDAATGVTVSPVINQTLDRWGNVVAVSDPRSAGWITQYRYNAFDQVIERIQPDGNGQITAASPDTRTYYDRLGRSIAVRDADNHVNAQRYDAAGDLVEEVHADGGHVRYGYDAFGDRVKMVDAMGNPTAYAFDRTGNLVQAIHAPVAVYSNDSTATFLGTQALTDTYVYDEAGRRIRVTNGAGETTKYDFDTRGNVVKITLPMGQVTQRAFDANNYKIAELDANDNSSSWTYDYFGKLLGHTDIGKAVYTYSYDFLNNLLTQTNSRGQNLAQGYDAAGQLTSITDNAIGQLTTYGYDAAGNHVLEVTTQGGVTYQNNHIAYDTLGRLALVDDGRYHITMSYDGVGNRTRETVHYVNDSGTVIDHDFWYVYDAMNRETIVEGTNSLGVIGVTTAGGHQLVYDLNGNRTSDFYYGVNPGSQTPAVDESGTPIFSTSPAFVTRHYSYDALNRLGVADQDGLVLERRDYDAASRLVRGGPDGGPQGFFNAFHEGEQINFYTYDANGHMVRNRAVGSDGLARFDSTFSYDGVGNATSHTVAVQNSTPYTNFFTSTYALFDGIYKEVRMDGTSTTLLPGTTVETYDVNGYLTAVNDATDASANRSFVNDASGKILQRNWAAQSRHELIVNGQSMGISGDNSVDDTFSLSYRRIGNDGALPNQSDGYTVQRGDSLQSIAQSVWGDASLWYLIADANGLAGNDQLRIGQSLVIPARVNGANNSADVFKPYDASKLVNDTQPNMPAPPAQSSGGGGCGGFGFIIVLIVTIIVAIYAPYLLGVVAEVGEVSLAGAIVGAVAGNIAGQIVGNIVGIQDGFSFKAVAVAAITAGVTEGLVELDYIPGVEDAGPAEIAMHQAVSTAVNQGARMLVGLQHGFDWKAVAASGLAAYAGATAAEGVNNAFSDEVTDFSVDPDTGDVTNTVSNVISAQNAQAANLASSFARGVTSSLVTTWVRGGKVDIARIATDAFGNTIASSIGAQLGRGSQQQGELDDAEQNAFGNQFSYSNKGMPEYVSTALGALPIASTRASQLFQSFASAYASGVLSDPVGMANGAEQDPEEATLPENNSGTTLPNVALDYAGNVVAYNANNGASSMPFVEDGTGDHILMGTPPVGTTPYTEALYAQLASAFDDASENGSLSMRGGVNYADAGGLSGITSDLSGAGDRLVIGGPATLEDDIASLNRKAEYLNSLIVDKAAANGESLAPTAQNAARLGLYDTSDPTRLPVQLTADSTALVPSPGYRVPDSSMYTISDSEIAVGGPRLGDVIAWSSYPPVGPSGLSPEGAYVYENVHAIATQRAISQISPDISADDLLTIDRAQQLMDSAPNQAPRLSFLHAMRDGTRQPDGTFQTVEQAQNLADQFVRDRFQAAFDLMQQGDREHAMVEFGMALHTLQDNTSPSHEGFQPWTNPGHPWDFAHGAPELKYPGDNSNLFRTTQEAYRWFINGKLPEGNLFRR